MAGEAFQIELDVGEHDIDQLGHVNNVVYVRWVQEAAVAHWRDSASAEEQRRLVWVVVRHEIDYKRAAHAGDRIVVRTWVGEASRATFERLTEISRRDDGAVLARARTLWCPLDAATGRPTQVSGEIRRRFSAAQSALDEAAP